MKTAFCENLAYWFVHVQWKCQTAGDTGLMFGLDHREGGDGTRQVEVGEVGPPKPRGGAHDSHTQFASNWCSSKWWVGGAGKK